MNTVREEEQSKKNSCPSRGLGFAAAAIGVGLGAALYYYCSKRQEDPDREGSTSTWREEHALQLNLGETIPEEELSDRYSTISEHSTTDTSIHDDEELTSHNMSHHLSRSISSASESESESSSNDSRTTDNSNVSDDTSEHDHTQASDHDTRSWDSEISDDENDCTSDNSNITISSDSSDDSQIRNAIISSLIVNRTPPQPNLGTETDVEWDVTRSSADVPIAVRREQINSLNRFIGNISTILRPSQNRTAEANHLNQHQAQAFRQRSWSLEECSICFDVILKDQQVTTLPCTHHFHTGCIKPWLEEQQTCPNCRKAAQ